MLLENPQMTNQELGVALGYAPMTVSIIINSDAFKAMLAQRKAEIQPLAVAPLQARARAVAALALERLGQKVQTVNDPETLLTIADKMMSQAEPKAQAVAQQNNVFMVTASELKQAREAIINGATPPQGAEAVAPLPEQTEEGLVISGTAKRLEDEPTASAGEVPSA